LSKLTSLSNEFASRANSSSNKADIAVLLGANLSNTRRANSHPLCSIVLTHLKSLLRLYLGISFIMVFELFEVGFDLVRGGLPGKGIQK
jgi:hypothetical protein